MLTVNLTTTFQRLNLCKVALASLLLQSRLPDKINVWVSKEPYLRDQGIADKRKLDSFLEYLPKPEGTIVVIRWVENIGPYRKLIPMLREADENDIIVTADDDIFYGQDWLKTLLEAYDAAEGMAVAARVRLKEFNFLGLKTSYIYWGVIKDPLFVKSDYVVTFGGGAVLTRSMFLEEDIKDDSFIKVAPTADDLWYSFLLSRKGTPVKILPNLLDTLYFINHSDGLAEHNFPISSNFFKKLRIKFWDRFVGYLGFPVSVNDESYIKINNYFKH